MLRTSCCRSEVRVGPDPPHPPCSLRPQSARPDQRGVYSLFGYGGGARYSISPTMLMRTLVARAIRPDSERVSAKA